MDDRLYWLWLANGLSPGAHQLPALLEAFDDAAGVWENRVSLLRRHLVTPAQQKALATTGPEAMEAILRRHEQAGVQVLTYASDAYPPLLRTIDSPPPVLYLVGDAACLSAPLTVGMVGTRRPSAYGVDAAAKLADGLAAGGAVLVSGLADGLDGEAHKAAVRAKVPTVAVLGTAIDQCFPARNAALRRCIEQCGAVVSELAIGTPGQPGYFLARNRIIAGLSRAVCVVEARLRSGTMSTVRFALEYGREVFAVPGSIFSPLSEGTNSLLAEGARVLSRSEDLLADPMLAGAVSGDTFPDRARLLHRAQEMDRAGPAAPQLSFLSPQSPAVELAELSAPARQLADCLGAEPKSFEQLCAEAQLSAGSAMAALTELELAGVALPQPGRRYLKKG